MKGKRITLSPPLFTEEPQARREPGNIVRVTEMEEVEKLIEKPVDEERAGRQPEPPRDRDRGDRDRDDTPRAR